MVDGAVQANSGRPGGCACVWRRDLKQVTSRQADKQPASWNKSLGGCSLSRLLAFPWARVWLWVRVLGDRRPKGIGWHLAPERCGDTGGLWLLDW